MKSHSFFQKISPLVLLLFLLAPQAGQAAEIVVVLSAALPVYNSAAQGLAEVVERDVPSQGQKAIIAHTLTTTVLAEAQSPVQLHRQIVDGRPDLLVAIGSSALSLVKDIPDTPIVYLMVPFPGAVLQERATITGISMNLSAGQQLSALRRAAPAAKKIGVLYDPARSESLVAEARKAAVQNRFDLLAVPVTAPDQVPSVLAALRGGIDWLWLVPDLTVLTPQSVDYLMLFSLENRVPIFAFAGKYLEMGAILAAASDPYDLGRQAGEMVLRLLHGTPVAELPPQEPRKVVVEVNEKAAKILGVPVQESGDR